MQTIDPSSITILTHGDFTVIGHGVLWEKKAPTGAVGEIILAVCLGTVSVIALLGVLSVMAYAGIQAIL